MRTDALEDFVADLFVRAGVPDGHARLTASSLVEADLEGVPSHGVMLVPMYVDRLLAGSVLPRAEARIAHDGGAVVVLDAGNGLGQVSSMQAVDIATARARQFGIAAVAVRNAFHFGTAGRWAGAIASHGLVGVVMSNTRPLMPPPGGAERVVGNNPLALAFPSAQGEPVVTDMAMSATAMGRIRLAQASGQSIPPGWATDERGEPTTDPAAAIKGMLLPAAGPKGFGLAVAIDLLCGGLSGGAIADEVAPLYGDPKRPYGCAHLFLALDAVRFGVEDLPARAGKLAERIRSARRAPGTDTIYAPGDLERSRRNASAGAVNLPAEVLTSLSQTAARLGVDHPAIRAG